MTDIDFDELDKAVNSLVNPSGAGSTPSPASSVDPTPASVAPATSTDTPDAPVPSSVGTTQPLAARRSAGRFMDVVHPSSDMRVTVPPRETSRVGATIAAPAAVAAMPTPTAPTTMPDPLDFGGSSAPADDGTDIAQIADDINKSLAGDTQAPLESPFLSDAKVEKRPLGAFSASSASAAMASELAGDTELAEKPAEEVPAVDEKVDEKKDEEAESPAATDTPLPAELQDDLLSIEASEETAAPKPVEPFAAGAAAATASETPIGPTSITQQYTESASTGDQPAGNVFDTEAYKKPLAHPKKKKSGWLLVLWILLLLVVGAGAGAAVYFYVLPLL